MVIFTSFVRWIMGYVSRPQLEYSYTPSAVLLVGNDAEKTSSSVAYEKVKSIMLVQTINKDSKFRYSFDIRKTLDAGPIWGRIYKNGVAVGTEQTANDLNFTTYTEDINVANWQINDTIELWLARKTSAEVVTCRNFRIYGSGSSFINTLGA